jgi:hypothetical protein
MSWHNRLAAVPVTYSRGVHVKRNPIWLELNEQCIFISLFDRLNRGVLSYHRKRHPGFGYPGLSVEFP